MVMIEVITQNKKKPGVLLPRSPPFGDRSTESGCRCRQQPEVFVLRSSYGRPAQSLKIFFRQMSQEAICQKVFSGQMGPRQKNEES